MCPVWAAIRLFLDQKPHHPAVLLFTDDAVLLAPGQLANGGGHVGVFDGNFDQRAGRQALGALLVCQQTDGPANADQIEPVRWSHGDRLPVNRLRKVRADPDPAQILIKMKKIQRFNVFLESTLPIVGTCCI